MGNSYKMSDGTRIAKSEIDQKVREAKQKKIDMMMEENIDSYGFYYDCRKHY